MTKEYSITGMTCASCAAHVEKAACSVPGVERAQVNLLSNKLTVEQAGDDATGRIIAAVQDAGYGASVPGAQAAAQAEDPAKAEHKALRLRLIVSMSFMVPMMYLSMAHMVGLPLPWFLDGMQYHLVNAFTQFLLALPVLYINRKVFANGFKQLFKGAPAMDSLIAVGSGAALVYGVFSLYRMIWGFAVGEMDMVHTAGMELYFESSVMILALITLGKFLESRAKGKTGDAIRALMELAPDTADVLRDGQTVTIPLAEVQVGDKVLVRPGGRVPVDGVLLEGTTAVDQSAITGESIPVDKKAGDALVAGSVNQTGAIVLEARKVGQDTTLMQIVHLVEQASGSKAPIAKLADKIAGVFVPVVMSIALVTFIAWLIAGQGFAFALSMGIAVLVISCPCALGLATPVAIMVGTGVGAKHGILVKSAEALEAAHAIDTVVLDKTGTITEGAPKVVGVSPAPGVAAETLLETALALEKTSEHPLAKAVMAYGQGRNAAEASQVTSVPGKGLSGQSADGEALLGGTMRFLREEQVQLLPDADGAQGGETLLHFARAGKYLGAIAVADTIKPTSREAVAAFKRLGIRVLMMTGDSRGAAQTIAQQAGVDEVLSEVLPQDKEAQVRKLQEAGAKVAMVGDGINDAPALTRADVGIAIGAGTDIAIDAADVVLVRSDLRDAVTAVRLSRSVLRNIKENLFWAFFYNCVGIPLAAGVFYPLLGWRLSPMFAAAAMSFSSVFVVSNALRLRSFKVEQRETETTQATTETKEKPKMTEKKMLVEGMHCGHCKAAVEKALKAVPGVTDCVVDLESKTAAITLNAPVEDAKLMDAVRAADFDPQRML